MIRIVTVNDGASELVVFAQADGSAEAVILRGNWHDASHHIIPPPPEGYRIVTMAYPSGERVVGYRKIDE